VRVKQQLKRHGRGMLAGHRKGVTEPGLQAETLPPNLNHGWALSSARVHRKSLVPLSTQL
jgi:hypothetical protein